MTVAKNPIFRIRETHGRVDRPVNRVVAHSEKLGWRSLYAAILQESPLDVEEAASEHPSFIYHLYHPTEVTRQLEGSREERTLIGPRRMCVTPGGASARWKHNGQPEILQVYIRQTIYETAVNELYGCPASGAAVVPRFAIVDPFLEQMALATANALREGREDGLYIDSLAQMMAVHLASQHCSRVPRSSAPQAANSLPSWKMRRLVDFIESNLESDLSLEKMAAEVGISPLYLPRAFKSAFGQSPHQYVLSRRIERAKELLRNTNDPVVEIALSCGFSSQSHLANWFSRVVGATPATYRKQA
ncbi:MAG: AraC family transcriptional regulator [Bryobacteraceae bacterium]